MKILIVEDEEKLADMLKEGLEREGHSVDYVTDGEEAQNRILMYGDTYELIILDLMLPGKGGHDICIQTRKAGVTTPILVLTARDLVNDKVSVLNDGADDYLTKPFSYQELLARVNALSRRPTHHVAEVLAVGNVSLNRTSRDVLVDSQSAGLSKKEFMILEYFMLHPDIVVTRDELYEKLWDFNADASSNTIDVHIFNLRKKISWDDERFETIRGVGYRLKTD